MVGELKVFSRYRETYKGLKSFEVLKVTYTPLFSPLSET